MLSVPALQVLYSQRYPGRRVWRPWMLLRHWTGALSAPAAPQAASACPKRPGGTARPHYACWQVLRDFPGLTLTCRSDLIHTQAEIRYRTLYHSFMARLPGYSIACLLDRHWPTGEALEPAGDLLSSAREARL